HAAFHAHLPLQRRPEEQQTGVRIGRQLLTLAAVVVGVEAEPLRIDALEEHGACGRASLCIGGGQRHGGGFGQLGLYRGRQPVGKLIQRIARDMRFVERLPRVFLAQFREIHVGSGRLHRVDLRILRRAGLYNGTPIKGRAVMSVIDYDYGISAVDSGYVRPQLDAIHLIVERGRAAVVDTGTQHSVAPVLAALRDKGIAPEAVDYVILTHIHLDQAGGAGALMQALPAARLVVHPRGVRHMVDPSRLVEGTVAVYGAAETQRRYGDIPPVPAARVLAAPADGMQLELAGRARSVYE